MNNNIKQIVIKNSCHESWNKMTAVFDGKYCESCKKNVIDFTGMTNCEIVNYLNTNKNVCGRFIDNQFDNLNQNLIVSQKRVSFFKNYKFAALFAGILTLTKAEAKPKEPAKYIQLQSIIKDNVNANDSLQFIKVHGIVKDENGKRISGVTITVPGTKLITTTNSNGYFKLMISQVANCQLSFKFIGYQAINVPIIPDKRSKYKITLKQQAALMGEVIITRPK